MSYELNEAARMANRAIQGSPWTGALDKREVSQAVHRLIQVAEALQRENAKLKAGIPQKRVR